MREPRNPFRWRASEHIIPDATFLRLFSPKTLDLLPQDSWDKVLIIQSAPGGGKTSLLRVFTPSALLSLYRNRTNDDYKDLYRRLESMGIISESVLDRLGVMLSCAQSYAMLEDMDIDALQKERLMYSLLNVRIILAALRGICVLRNLNYPRDLREIQVENSDPGQFPEWISVPVPCSGKQLAEWATNIEENICESVDSFNPISRASLKGHDSLYALQLLRPEALTHNAQPIVSRVLVMLDDVHKLTSRQRNNILDTLLNQRWPVSVWLAERIEALTASELFSFGATSGRDYETIRLEDYWSANQKRFENVATTIADKRSRLASDVEISSFSGYLENTLEVAHSVTLYEKASRLISRRLYEKYGIDKRFKEWLEICANYDGTEFEQAVEWRKLEILIERKVNEAQMLLPIPLSDEEMEKSSSSIQTSAEYFLSQELELPYYFGFSKLAILASSNIEQFLDFAGELFEQIISYTLLDRSASLSPRIQQESLKRVADRRWKEIPRRVPNGHYAQNLLIAIREYARKETNKPNAPYAPGVTGIGLSMKDRASLIDPDIHKIHPEYRYLANLLSDCISNNLLEPRFITQGQKGQMWMVLYLNRWLCLQGGLPLQYGGWRPVKLEKIYDWLEKGFDQPDQKRSLL